MTRTRILRAVAVPAAGLLAITLAAVGTAATGSNADDGEPASTDDNGGTVSQSVSQQEAEEAADYWTPERMRNAKPG